MENKIQKTNPWEDYADEHILYIRTYDNEVSPSVFEGVMVQPGDFGTVRFLHSVVFMDDYLSSYELDKSYLDGILNNFGYAGLDDFVIQNAPEPISPVYKENGDIDRVKTRNYIIDLRLLASLIFEDRGGDFISPELAAQLVKSLTGYDVGEFIQRLATM